VCANWKREITCVCQLEARDYSCVPIGSERLLACANEKGVITRVCQLEARDDSCVPIGSERLLACANEKGVITLCANWKREITCVCQ
jgi:hypothetical protein